MEVSLDVKFNSASNEYPHCILLLDPATPKTRNIIIIITFFSGISCFGGTRVHQTYVVWVLVRCEIKLCIQRVPTMYTFDGSRYPKNKIYLKKRDDDMIITFFQVFLVFRVEGSVKSMQCGCSLDAELNSASNELPRLKFK